MAIITIMKGDFIELLDPQFFGLSLYNINMPFIYEPIKTEPKPARKVQGPAARNCQGIYHGKCIPAQAPPTNSVSVEGGIPGIVPQDAGGATC